MGTVEEKSPWTQPAVIPGRTMVVLYGSETGNAEEIAKEIGDLAERLHFQTSVGEMDSFKLADVVRSSLAVFVTSTTGQGDMPKNTTKFWKNLRREKLNNTNCLGSVRFTIFGLGDSSYLKFNWAARKLQARLLQLGATEFFKAGEGDERHDNGIDSIYFPWFEELKKTLISDFPLPDHIQPIPEDFQLPPKYPLEILPDMEPRTMSSGGKPEEAPGGKPEETLSEEERKYREKQFDRAEISHVDPSFHPPAVMKVAEWTRRHEPEFPAERARADHRWEQDHPREFWLLDKGNILKDDPEKYRLQRAHLVDFPDPERCPPAIALPVPNMVQVRVVENSRVTPPDHWQDVRFIALQAPAMQKEFVEALKLNLGSMTLSIYPMNYPEDVEELISLMGWEEYADKPLRRPYHRPKNLYLVHNDPTLRELLTHNLDITAVPKRSFIRELTWMTNNEREKERLKELIKSGQQQELYDYTSRPRRTIIEMLRDFPNVKIPFQRVLDLFPIIRPREFSVANGTLEAVTDDKGNPCVILEILAALVEYKTIIRKPRQGLCSRYLKTLRVGTEISVQINRSTSPNLHTHPMYAQRPMIAIATGTGIAPIRAMLQRRRDICLRDRPAPTLLFFGCRNRAADFYFEHEWAQDRYRNWLTVYPAFSRDGIEPDRDATVSATSAASPLPVPMAQAAGDLSIGLSAIYAGAMPSYDVHKNYVQHLIRKHGREVAALLAQRNAYICVCGNAGRMPLSVRAALMDVLVKWEVVKNVEEAEKWLGNPANVTYWQECW